MRTICALPLLWVVSFAAFAGDTLEGLERNNGFIVAGHAWTWGKGTLFEAIEKTQRAGANALEVYLMGQKISADTGDAVLDETTSDALIEKVHAKCREHKVRIINAYIGQKQWTRIAQDEAALRKFFEFGKKFGLSGFTGEPAEAQWDMLEKLVKEFGLTFSIHNHAKSFEAPYFAGPYKYWDPRYTAQKLEAQKRDARFGLCLDTGHVARSGLDVVEVFKGLQGRCISLHLKNVKASELNSNDIPYTVGGVVDIPALLNEIKRAGLKSHIALEYEWFESPTFDADIKGLVDYIGAFKFKD